MRIILVTLALLAGIASGAERTVYLAPRQSIALLAAPQLGTPSGHSVTTGDPLAVVAEQDGFVQVRTADGTTGWVRRVNLTEVAPETPGATDAELARLGSQVTTLDAQIQAFQAENAALRARVSQREDELAELTRPTPLTLRGLLDAIARLIDAPWAWVLCGSFVLGILLAFRAGARYHADKVRARIGGLEF